MIIAPQIDSLAQLANLVTNFLRAKKSLNILYIEMTQETWDTLLKEYLETVPKSIQEVFLPQTFTPESYFDETYRKTQCAIYFKIKESS